MKKYSGSSGSNQKVVLKLSRYMIWNSTESLIHRLMKRFPSCRPERAKSTIFPLVWFFWIHLWFLGKSSGRRRKLHLLDARYGMQPIRDMKPDQHQESASKMACSREGTLVNYCCWFVGVPGVTNNFAATLVVLKAGSWMLLCESERGHTTFCTSRRGYQGFMEKQVGYLLPKWLNKILNILETFSFICCDRDHRANRGDIFHRNWRS